MSDTPWTPGPWRVSGAKPTKTRGFDILAGYSKLVASAPAPNDLYRDRSEREANANLIAAAPDMAEALDALLSAVDVWAETPPGSDDEIEATGPISDAAEAARAALAKAKGATP